MADSVHIEQSTGRPVGGSVNGGRLHRGHGKVAASASIPSKYQTIVSDNSEKKGFLSRSRRFADGGLGANPGPGRYEQPRPIEMERTSFSKKGTGGFASKSKRFPRKAIRGESGPGPGEYDQKLPQEHYYNRSGATSNFHLPIAVARKEDKINSFPAPNHYNVGNITGRVAHDNNVAACAAFRSKSKRNWILSQAGPSPCHYTINDQLIKDAPKGVTAPFKSTTERKMARSPLPFPGPGTYKPYDEGKTLHPRDRHGFLNKHYLCISAPALPLPLPDPNPGPGHYNIVDYEGPPKHFMSSSAFVSATSRWGNDATVGGDDEAPGPATYRPQQTGKQSFIYNANARWVPG
ncbi:predicted protein [Nematostella vectensis]|uniref:O(6)-methylguanine-induced apoptosis 2 n=1 Tax=Nematostella vectensis TaxID=45351 RepID=A7SM96_NEMVE|nr:O(6)-methylguanine-induced apoptosis 2 [Nematostella vectensis]EDO35197.1 predicted protein [Nematostella vectensis]|eukprot:XP_001627297.1 predicted protein [Nematostella vectensis]